MLHKHVLAIEDKLNEIKTEIANGFRRAGCDIINPGRNRDNYYNAIEPIEKTRKALREAYYKD